MARQIRVVVVDDSPLIREMVKKLLCSYDDLSVVAEAADGKQALVLVERARPDVLVMDIQMPVMGGLAALDIMKRAFWPSPVVIIITGSPDEEYRSRVMSSGAYGFLGKEQLAALPALIKAATRKQSQSDED